MKKTAIAFDIGESYIKIAKRDGDKITVEVVQMPENLKFWNHYIYASSQ